MGIFDRWKKNPIVNSVDKETALSGQKVDFPNESNLPVVNNWTDKGGMVHLGYSGSDMILPLLIEQSVYESPAHKSCVKLKVSSAIGAGYTLTPKSNSTDDKLQMMQFESVVIKDGLDHFIQNITRDFVLHNRINIKVTKKGEFTEYQRVNPSQIGYDLKLDNFFYSRDFSQSSSSKIYKAYKGQREGVFMCEYDGNVDKYEPYAVPEWLSVFPNIKINSLIPRFHEENMENSVGISLVIRKPTEFQTDDEKKKYSSAVKSNAGVKGTGKFLILSGNGFENVAEVQQLQPNQNDKLFNELRNSTIDDICIGHNVNPVLIGVKTPGSLGASSEFDIAYNIMYQIEVVPIVNHINKVINDILRSIGYTFTFKLNENNAMRNMNKVSNESFKMTKI